MLRLFSLLSLLLGISAALWLGTGTLFFRLLTLFWGLVVVLLYFYLGQGLGAKRGRLHLPGLKESVEVFWDERGVPHIYARNLHDLYMAQGYVTARDHLWSMDIDRRLATGSLAEIVGPELLAVDKFFRTLGLRRVAAESFPIYNAEGQSHLEAYAEGVNAFIAQRHLPPEFRLLRYQPAPWTAVDTLAVGKLLAFGLAGNWDTELFHAHLVQAVGAAKAAELFLSEPDPDLLALLEQTPLPDTAHLAAVIEAALGDATGSNSWVVSGFRTRSGAPMLANDPRLPVHNPSHWYETHLVGPDGVDVTGVTCPGVPGILAGHNREIAWGITNLSADVQDLFLEEAKPDAPDHFRYAGEWERATTFIETIAVKGNPEPERLEVLVSRHGPVIARGATTALALSWTGLRPSTELESILAYNRARCWTDFRTALQTFASPAQSFVFAGRDGTIAYRAAGQVPIRSRGDGQAPVPGWSGEYEWTGSIPFEALPERVNPPEGYIVTADQAITPAGYDYLLGSAWAPPYRAQRIEERLRGATALDMERLQQIQTDTANLQARSLLQTLLQAVQEGLRSGNHPLTMNDVEKRALLLLSGWECGEPHRAAAPAVWHQWYQFLMEEIFRPQMGLTLYNEFLRSGLPVQVTDRLLTRRTEGAECLWLSSEGEGALPAVALRSFRRAVALLRAKQGQEPEAWRWGKEHTLAFLHPLAASHRWLGLLFNLGPYPAGGSGFTVNYQGYQRITPFRVAGSPAWRQIVDLAHPEESTGILAPGQSGHPLSPHHSDQLHAYLAGEYHHQPFHHAAIRKMPLLLLQPAPNTRTQEEIP
ncbi:MAG: penicillin acylase family protein [Mycobacterium leprae]